MKTVSILALVWLSLSILDTMSLSMPDETRVRFPEVSGLVEESSATRSGLSGDGLDQLLPKPAPCSKDASYCGDDPSLYPVDAIERLVSQSVALKQSSVTRDRFFKEPSKSVLDEKNFELACATRTSFIPRYARAKNLRGKWRYLVQPRHPDGAKYQISVCEHPGKTCLTDIDSPAGEKTTVCRQIQRTHKLLSVDESGKMVVDSFPLPSACICKFKEDFFGLRSAAIPQAPFGPQCPIDEDPQIDLEEVVNIAADSSDSSAIVFGSEDRRTTATRTDSPSVPSTSTRPMSLNESDCDEASSWSGLCEHTSSYPFALASSSLASLNASTSTLASLFGSSCSMPTEPVLRNSFDLSESALCTSTRTYLFPQRARNVRNEWKYIVNTKEFKQGVSAMLCDPISKDRSCRYGGQEGLYPHATTCKQLYSQLALLAIEEDGRLDVDTFNVPSACVCTIVDKEAFLF